MPGAQSRESWGPSHTPLFPSLGTVARLAPSSDTTCGICGLSHGPAQVAWGLRVWQGGRTSPPPWPYFPHVNVVHLSLPLAV